jgi:hypothetical protein
VTPAAGFTQPEEGRSARSASALVRTPAAAKSSALKPNHIRSLALAAAVVGVALLPIAAAQATPPQTSGQTQNTAQSQNGQSGSAPAQALSGTFCSDNQSESISGGAVQLQTCVQQQNGTVFAQAYVTNGSTVPQIVAVNLTRSDGTLVQNQCVVAPGTASTLCATSPIPASQGSGAYDSVAEAAGQGRPLSDGAVHVESGLVAPVPATSSPSSDS